MIESYATTVVRNLPKDATLYTIVRHVSASGMMRVIDVYVIVNGDMVNLRGAFTDMGYKTHPKHDGVKVHGAGMDMAWNLTYVLGMRMHDDGYYFAHRSL